MSRRRLRPAEPMTGADLLCLVAAALEAAGIPFMLTGSLASAYHGAGRSTMDLDLVVDPTAHQLTSLIAALTRPGLYVPAEAARAALDQRGMFNVIDTATGWKADLIIRKARPFSETEFERRVPIEYEGVALHVATVEDLIIAKLEWAKKGGSARQLEDVSALVRVRAGDLDRGYIDRWVIQLDLEEQWRVAQPDG